MSTTACAALPSRTKERRPLTRVSGLAVVVTRTSHNKRFGVFFIVEFEGQNPQLDRKGFIIGEEPSQIEWNEAIHE
jgi:hypothetical protein